MKQLLFGALVGCVILFVWGWLTWSLIPIHISSIRNIGNEDSVISAMRINMDRKGVYVFPGMPAPDNKTAMDTYTQKCQRGPMGFIVYNPEGSDPMPVSQMVIGLVLFFISAYIASWFLSRSTAAASGYIVRVSFCGMLGLFISISTHILNWNWMDFPFDYTLSWVLDSVVGWLLAGLGIAAIVKTQKPAEPA